MTQADPNTDDYAQFVGRIAFETREAMAPHLATMTVHERLIDRVRRVLDAKYGGYVTTEAAEALNYYWGSRNHTARVLSAPKYRPVFVHCTGCRLPVTPSGWRFTFSPVAMAPEKMSDACQSAQRWHSEGAMS